MTQHSRTTSSKKTITKKNVHISRTRLAFMSIGIFVLAVSSVIVISLLASQVIVVKLNDARLERIQEIYNSLELGEEYRVTGSNVFGDKRVYEWDKGRTYSSAMEYLRGETVGETVADLDAKIKAAGFTFIDEPYPGTKETQYHYKSDKGEYIRLSVGSKPYWDAVLNASVMNQELSEEAFSMDTNLGPARVTIKVNLDDNNE